jgi:molybdopterin/thiamine biosynthesis adenylyltransferase
MLNPDLTTIQLNQEEYERYSRHLILPEVGVDGQKKLKAASVLCIGTGGLGSPLLLYLAAAGIGRLGIVDFDVVDASNMQRQVIHSTSTIGKLKIESAKQRIHEINPHCQVDLYNTMLSSANALEIMEPYDVIVDGTDNFPTRYLVNDACVLLNKPNVYGSIFRFEGQATVFNYEGGPNYRDLYPEPPPPGLVPSCAEGGVLGILPGLIGVIQATETVKIILGVGTTLSGRLLLYDSLNMKFRELKLRPNPVRPVIEKLIDYQEFCGIPQAAAAQADQSQLPEMTVEELKQIIDSGAEDYLIVDVRNPNEWEIGRIPGTVLMPLPEIENGDGVSKIKSMLEWS